MKFNQKIKENKFQGKLQGMLEAHGAKVLNVHGHMMQKSGWPDLFVSHWDFTGWIELKVDDRKATTLQEFCIKDLRVRGTKAFFLRFDNDDQTLQLDEVPGLCWKARDISKENVIETLNVMWEHVLKKTESVAQHSTDEDADFQRLLEEKEENYEI